MRSDRLTSVLLQSAALFWTGALMLQTAEATDIGLKISAEKNWLSWGDYILGQDMKSGLFGTAGVYGQFLSFRRREEFG